MFDNKIKKKLEKLLSGVDASQMGKLLEMVESGENIEKSIDFNKASQLLKSLNLENEVTPDMISKGIDKLKENPEILSELTKKK